MSGLPGASEAPKAWAILEATRPDSVRAARSTNHTPSAKLSSASAATCKPNLVLPVPPGPVRVKRLTSGRLNIASTCSLSRSRPTSAVAWRGKLFGWLSSVLRGGYSRGNPGPTAWKMCSGR